MAIAGNHLMLGLLIITLSLGFTVGQIGVSFGRNGAGLPPTSQVVELFDQYNIQRMRIYDPDQDILDALRGSNIEVTVGIKNPDLQSLADNPNNAKNWVRDNIMKYPSLKFRHVVVGNEVRPGNKDTQQYVPYVLKAMQNIRNAISPLRPDIKVTTAVDMGIIEPGSGNPPGNGRFRPDAVSYMDPIVQFLVDTDAPLFANIYPYFAYLADPDNIPLPYALLDPKYPGVNTTDGIYKNLYYAIVDTVYAALEKIRRKKSGKIPEVKGAETGWATLRGPGCGNAVASIKNARAYVNNLIQAVKNGTVKRPGQPIETYIFAMFDENLKPGNLEERNFGLFTAAGKPKYRVNFN